MRTLATSVTLVVILTTLVAPSLVLAQINIWEGTGSGGVTCNKATTDSSGKIAACTFCDALVVGKNIVNLLLEFALVAATVMIVVGALIMMFAGGSEEKFATGKRAILNAVIGMAIALASWLIINTVIQFLAPGEMNVPWADIRCS